MPLSRRIPLGAVPAGSKQAHYLPTTEEAILFNILCNNIVLRCNAEKPTSGVMLHRIKRPRGCPMKIHDTENVNAPPPPPAERRDRPTRGRRARRSAIIKIPDFTRRRTPQPAGRARIGPARRAGK
ncbi:hypothetical protein EVAR_81473_1 [Eumeta japonica]|uniref:Uncharacterized protein n=1 Tax=Eumeta variegata TaxID=151549 RepID=A0A4C1W3N3_EUMVA|nr:hypothetical protein EVAR_81473_1 [Eumeta japonica]